MQITALTDIVEGNLLNAPSISFVTQIHTNLAKVNEGDAFFATNEDDIPKAIEKGAFAIITEFKTSIVDNEIAWIKTDNLEKAICNILRFNLLKHNIKYIHTNKVFFNLLNTFKSKELSYIIILKDNLSSNFELLNNIIEDKIIFGTNIDFLESIGADVLSLENKIYDVQNLTSHSLFETSFSYKDKFFDKIKIPTVYINDLLQQLELFEYKADLKKLNNINLFKPLFINKSNQIVQFGQTNRFILANEDKVICDIEIEYLKEHYSYANIKVINTIQYSEDEIFSYIKNNNFNALYLCGTNHKKITKILENNYDDNRLL